MGSLSSLLQWSCSYLYKAAMTAQFPHSYKNSNPPNPTYPSFCTPCTQFILLFPLWRAAGCANQFPQSLGLFRLAGFGSVLQNCCCTRGSCPGRCGCWPHTLQCQRKPPACWPEGHSSEHPSLLYPLASGSAVTHVNIDICHGPAFVLSFPAEKTWCFSSGFAWTFFLTLFFYTAFLWRAWKKENLFCKGCFFYVFFVGFFFPGNVNSLHRYSGNFSLFFYCVTQETKRGTLSLRGSKSLYLLLKADLVLFDSLAVLLWQWCTKISLS